MTSDSLTLCRDCGVDAWWFEENGRVVHEDFYVDDNLWNATCPEDAGDYDDPVVLCIGCFEARLGRELVRSDFKVQPHELFGDPPSARFLARSGWIVEPQS